MKKKNTRRSTCRNSTGRSRLVEEEKVAKSLNKLIELHKYIGMHMDPALIPFSSF